MRISLPNEGFETCDIRIVIEQGNPIKSTISLRSNDDPGLVFVDFGISSHCFSNDAFGPLVELSHLCDGSREKRGAVYS